MGNTVIIGGSAGSFKIISDIVYKLQPGFNFPILICMHRNRMATDNLIEVLDKGKSVEVLEAVDSQYILPGKVYIAPANRHLLISRDNRFILSLDPPVNYSRPSIDISMKSAAKQFGEKLTGILLTGANADGTEGLKAIRDAGGICIVQDPEDAEIPYMPRAAVDSFVPTHIMSANKIINFIENLQLS